MNAILPPGLSVKSEGTPKTLRAPALTTVHTEIFVSKDSSEDVCPVTHELIALYPRDDVFTTLSGIKYHKPTLKSWLQKSDVMPHSNVKAPEEIRRLWPQASQRGTKAWYHALMGLSGCSSAVFIGSAAILFASSGIDSPEKAHAWASRACRFEFMREGYTYADCVKLRAFTELSAFAAKNSGVDNHAQSATEMYSLLGVGLCLGVVSLLLFQNKPTGRFMSSEEIKKAELGLEYYEQKL